VLGSFLLILLSLFYFADNEEEKNNITTGLTLPEPAAEIKAPPVVNTPTKNKFDLEVVRAQLTSEIKKNEPIDTLKSPIKIGKKESLWLYYFLELKGMKGKSVFHEWLLNGELVSRKKVNISADPWRTASKQVITYTTNNDWLVRLVDESGNIINEKTFNLELKED
jgi:hypothetical protein